jgi:hypothetical protein
MLILAACDSQPNAPSAARSSPAPAVQAGEGACRLPLRHFNLAGHHELTGSRLGVPTDLVGIDQEGRLSWNNSPVGARQLGEYMEKAAASAAASPPYFLLVRPERHAPCAAVQQVLSAAVRLRRCSVPQCSFEWVTPVQSMSKGHADR